MTGPDKMSISDKLGVSTRLEQQPLVLQSRALSCQTMHRNLHKKRFVCSGITTLHYDCLWKRKRSFNLLNQLPVLFCVVDCHLVICLPACVGTPGDAICINLLQVIIPFPSIPFLHGLDKGDIIYNATERIKDWGP